MTSTKTILKKDRFPQLFLQSAQLVFPETTLFGIMLEIEELSQMLSPADLRGQWFTEEEQQRISTFKLEKRQNEWMCGRICAKLVAGQFCQLTTQQKHREIVVVNDPGGRPSLSSQEFSTPRGIDISISHSANLAVALLANNYCGIDIQENNDTLLRVKEYFCTTNDEETLGTFFNEAIGATELNLVWSAKEAIRKTLSYSKVPAFLALKLSMIELIQQDLYTFYFSYNNQTVSTICGPHKNYCLALCVQKGSAYA